MAHLARPAQTLGYRLGRPVLMTPYRRRENLRSRINSALGLTALGFKDRCALPAAGDLR